MIVTFWTCFAPLASASGTSKASRDHVYGPHSFENVMNHYIRTPENSHAYGIILCENILANKNIIPWIVCEALHSSFAQFELQNSTGGSCSTPCIIETARQYEETRSMAGDVVGNFVSNITGMLECTFQQHGSSHKIVEQNEDLALSSALVYFIMAMNLRISEVFTLSMTKNHFCRRSQMIASNILHSLSIEAELMNRAMRTCIITKGRRSDTRFCKPLSVELCLEKDLKHSHSSLPPNLSEHVVENSNARFAHSLHCLTSWRWNRLAEDNASHVVAQQKTAQKNACLLTTCLCFTIWLALKLLLRLKVILKGTKRGFARMLAPCIGHRLHLNREITPEFSSLRWLFLLVFSLVLYSESHASIDSIDDLSGFPCLEYSSSRLMFELRCSFHWSGIDQHCIKLHRSQIFEGHGYEVNISGVSDWAGLFQISETPTGLQNAPVIRNVHMIGGETSDVGGFLVQAGQKHFVVESCSSSGKIKGSLSDDGNTKTKQKRQVRNSADSGGGGICGQGCSGDIQIINCSSSGQIHDLAGGIAGRGIGENDERFSVKIVQCHSTGEIIGSGSGGICGSRTANTNGNITIEQCYSEGKISGSESGGITGIFTAEDSGRVSIADCYSRGNITGSDAGGICGSSTGKSGGTVSVTNVYTSGRVLKSEAGGLFGSIDGTGEVAVRMSVYDGSTGDMIGSDGEPMPHTDGTNSRYLTNITGITYCHHKEKKCWDNETTWKAVEDGFPIFRDVFLRTRETHKSCFNSSDDISAFSCLRYNSSVSMFELTCSFHWPNSSKNCILLRQGEIFEGHGHEVNITGFSDWEGLFQISDSVPSIVGAPMIQNVHMIGGETSAKGGFLVQALQKNFMVSSCSSTGRVGGSKGPVHLAGGGICGYGCSGHIVIANCSSSGDIVRDQSGGIVGKEVGFMDDEHNVNIANCHSTGAITGSKSGGIAGANAGWGKGRVSITGSYSTGIVFGDDAGGICGSAAGERRGQVYITLSYSTGAIIGVGSGGICGRSSGVDNGEVVVEQCYSVGEVVGDESGGIVGKYAAAKHGHVLITNCYSRGNIRGMAMAGGISGSCIGNNGGTMILTNVYASGGIFHGTSGGIIGQVCANASEVKITNSVYDGHESEIIGYNTGNGQHISRKRNSGSLFEITGSVYCYGDQERKECWDNQTVWQAIDDSLPVLRSMPFVSPKAHECIDSNDDLSSFPCLKYNSSLSMFELTCSFQWQDISYNCIMLQKGEVFDGHGHEVDISDQSEWEGLFQISKAVTGLCDAPMIRNVHMIGGETSDVGAFIVQPSQRHFTVQSCSSTGLIGKRILGIDVGGGGGICGHKCSGDIRIINCSSSGDIRGPGAGGIAGSELGSHGVDDGTTVTISHCYSTGVIGGAGSGGICGSRAAVHNGLLNIEKSYSGGSIIGDRSGGITGENTARRNGNVFVADCFSWGDITAEGAGGIGGLSTGNDAGTVVVTNVYAHGQIKVDDAGGLLGSVDFSANEVKIRMSVYDGSEGDMIGSEPDHSIVLKHKNSDRLADMTDGVYCSYGEHGSECWDEERTWQLVDNGLPILQEFPGSRECVESCDASFAFPCLEYTASSLKFELTCSFHVSSSDKTCIILHKNEVFEGHGYEVNVTGYSDWRGLFQIANSATGLDNAPTIRNVHILGGETSATGGFVVRDSQKHFVVDSCTSSGLIRGGWKGVASGGGGICGHGCSGDILITHCSSYGAIVGDGAGGITGGETGREGYGNNVTISHCHSTGAIAGHNSGGISGWKAGIGNGQVIIKFSYSTGNIDLANSGGICGAEAGSISGSVKIQQCYSVGEIRGDQSGGITGKGTAESSGYVSITNCYSRGNITGSRAAGVCGHSVANHDGTLILTNVYTTGKMKDLSSGGFVGSIRNDARNVGIIMSVYNGDSGGMSGLRSYGPMVDKRNSGNLTEITGTVYCYRNPPRRKCWDNETIWQSVDNEFPILQGVGHVGFDAIPSINPDSIEFKFARTVFDAPIIAKNVILSLGRNQNFWWHEPRSHFLQVPQGVVNAADHPDHRRINQEIKIDTSRAPVGNTTMPLGGNVTEGNKTVSVLLLHVTIAQGRVQALTEAIAVTASQSEPSIPRGVTIRNRGSHNVSWWVNVFDDNGHPASVSEHLPWLSVVPLKGNIPVGTSRSIVHAHLLPYKVQSTGSFHAWILVETDSWEGNTYPMSPSAPSVLSNVSTTSIHFWVHVNMRVTSVFFCKKSPIPPLRPMDTRIQTFTVVNLEPAGVTVVPTNFTLAAGSHSNESSGLYFLNEKKSDGDIALTPWMSISPAVTTIRAGASVTFELHVSFLAQTLPLTNDATIGSNITSPVSISLRIGFLVFLGGSNSFEMENANDHRDSSAAIHFTPGAAIASMSYILIVGTNTTRIPVSQSVEVAVVLVDQFGQEHATATYYSISNEYNEDESGVYVRDTYKDEIVSVSSPPLTDGQTTTGFSLTVLFRSEGTAKIDIALNGTSILGSPVVFEGQPMECTGPYEVPSTQGTQCMCKAGYRKSRRHGDDGTLGCIPCEEGTMIDTANRQEQCNECPDEYFCPEGSSVPISCPGRGVDCVNGKVFLKSEFWCEPCHTDSHPLEAIKRRQIDDPDSLVFHKCFREDSCAVNKTSFEVECNRGYTGPACSVCDDNFALNSEETACVPCSENGMDEFVVVMGIIVVLIALIVTTYRYSLKARRVQGTGGINHSRNIMETEEAKRATKDFLEQTHGPIQTQRRAASTYLEDLTLLVLDYFQLCAIVASLKVSPFQRVSSFWAELSELALLNPTQSSPFKCSFGLSYFAHATVAMMFPWILFIAICICQAIVVKVFLKTALTKNALFQGVLPVSLMAFDLLHASVTSATFGALQTYDYEVDGSTRASGDLSIEVGSSRHNALFGIALITLLIFVVGFPLLAAAVLLFKWKQGRFKELYIRFENWTEPFRVRQPGFVWPMLVVFRKFLLILVSQFVENALGQYLSFSLALVASYVFVAWMHPYRLRLLNHAEEFKLGLSLITVGLGFIAYSSDTLSKASSWPNTDIFLSALIVILQIFGLLAAGVAATFTLPHVVKNIRYVWIPNSLAWIREKTCSLCRSSRQQTRMPDTVDGQVMENPIAQMKAKNATDYIPQTRIKR